MNKNFSIRDAVFFELSGETLDARGSCELLSVEFRPGISATVEILWKIHDSNQQLQILFSQVRDFIFRGRDKEYPKQSGVVLSIAGFSGIDLGIEPELYVEPTCDMRYMTFVMNDMSALLIEAETAVMRRL